MDEAHTAAKEELPAATRCKIDFSCWAWAMPPLNVTAGLLAQQQTAVDVGLSRGLFNLRRLVLDGLTKGLTCS